jgi:hypothetical protein
MTKEAVGQSIKTEGEYVVPRHKVVGIHEVLREVQFPLQEYFSHGSLMNQKRYEAHVGQFSDPMGRVDVVAETGIVRYLATTR